MQVRNASGRQVSLLCDDSNSAGRPKRPMPQRPFSFHSSTHVLPRPSPASRSSSSSPNMPELLRSDSYDSQTSSDALSPMTPSDYAFSRTSLYPVGQDYTMDGPPAKRPAYAESRTTSYADDETSATSPLTLTERPGKRYPCRYRDSHGCEKTFTTSGHASRHSKIHTAEKAVQCTFHGCSKKFTRADNMKQHLETHYKDKSRSAHRGQKATFSARRDSTSSRSRSVVRETVPSVWGEEQYALPTPPMASPTGTAAAWDMRGFNLPLLNRPVTSRTPSSGLDALAMAIACQEGN